MRKLEIGPQKPEGRPGWDTVDVVPGATYQAKWGYDALPIPDNTYDYVFASHVLEHVPWFRTDAALAEIFRVLVPGGLFEVWVPDFQAIAEAYYRRTITRDGWFQQNPEKSAWKSLNGRLFWGARPGEVGQEQHFHRAAFDAAGLEECLTRAGFGAIGPATRLSGEGHGWIDLGRIARKQ